MTRGCCGATRACGRVTTVVTTGAGAGACSACGGDTATAGAGDGAMLDEVPAGTVGVSRVNIVRPNATAAINAAAAESPNNRIGTRRRDSFCSSHSSWLN